jgi:hypothetical protein
VHFTLFDTFNAIPVTYYYLGPDKVKTAEKQGKKKPFTHKVPLFWAKIRNAPLAKSGINGK